MNILQIGPPTSILPTEHTGRARHVTRNSKYKNIQIFVKSSGKGQTKNWKILRK